MFEKVSKITLSGQEYPIKCDLLVLEKAQKKYGSVSQFEKQIMSWEYELDENGERIRTSVKRKDGEEVEVYKTHGKIPNADAVLDALYWMACEGAAIAAEESGAPREEPTREGLARAVDIGLMELGTAMHEEFYRCFEGNRKATQNPEETGETEA